MGVLEFIKTRLRRFRRLDRQALGVAGEREAERMLKKQGWSTVARNVTYRMGEIDLVMGDPEGTLVFVEVKTRSSETFQPVEHVVTFRKKTRMRRAAKCFLASYKKYNGPCRFDVVVVVANALHPPDVRHYPNAFGIDA